MALGRRRAARRAWRAQRRLLAGATLAAAACSDPASSGTPVERVDVQPASLTITAGETGVLAVQLYDASGNLLDPRAVFWSSQDTSVASVNPAGLVTAIAPGKVQIAASIDGKSDVASVAVTRDRIILVRILPASGSVSVGNTLQLDAEARTGGGQVVDDPAVSWSSSNPAVATVNTAGLVTAHAAGSVSIRASVDDAEGAAVINVVPVPIAQIVVTPQSANLLAGQAVPFTATASDAAGNVLTGRTFVWSSSDDAVAVVSSSGRVQTLTAGTVIITASAEGKSGTATINISQPPATVATVEMNPSTASITVSQTVQITATPRDSQGNPLSVPVAWASSDSSVAVPNGSGLVTGLAPGNATITATAGTKSGSVPVSVASAVNTVSVTPSTLVLVAGTTGALLVRVQDAGGGSLPGLACTIGSSATAQASVAPTQATTDANGEIALTVTAHSLGGATITVTCEGKSGSAAVVVL
jgi:uncharacterized protein YjdB